MTAMDEAARDEAAPAADTDPARAAQPSGRATWERIRSIASRPVISYVIAFVLAFGMYHHSYTTLSKHGMTGDEPSYLLDAFSMARDHDRDLVGQDPDTLIGLFGIPAFPHTIHNTSAGDISIHGAGLPFALVPGVWIGDWQDDPIRWVRLEVVLIDALAALALFAVIRRTAELLKIHQAFTWAAWASAALSFSLVAYSDQLYPEVPALLCILIAIVAAMRPRPGWPAMVAGSAAAGYLPWLHVRFIPICFALLAALAVRGLSTIAARDRNAPGQPRSRIGELTAEARGLLRAAITRAGVIVLAAAALPALASFVIMAIEFQHWYGSPKWTITTGTGAGLSGGGGNTWYPLVFGGIFGTDFGWVPWAPIGVLALAATGCLLLEAPRWVTYALLVIAVYQLELAVSGLPSPGFVFAGRYEIICLPLFSVALMVALARVPVTWLAFIPLMLATIAISWQASERADANLLNTGAVGLGNAARLTSAFPDVEPNPTAPQSFTAEPATLAGTVGRLARGGKVRRARPADGMGYLAAGPRVGLTPGVYDGHFTVTQTGGSGRQPLVEVQIFALGPNIVLASKGLSAEDLADGKPTKVDFQFSTPGGQAIETRAYVTGRATVDVGETSVTPVALAPLPVFDRYPDGALMAAWIGGTFFLAVLLAYASHLKRRLMRREALA